MIEKTIPSAWLDKTGRRLDCGPYLSGAVEARITIDSLKVRKDSLCSVTTGYADGIYNGPQFVRNYVSDPTYGVPFLSSGSMLLADLTRVDLLKRKDAESENLKHLRLQRGMTLISCSGTIGRMVYTRPEMEDMWSSQDVLKVVPDPQKISAGYLYAYLASRIGVTLVTGGTYGAIIPHIEPEHVRQIPIPRFGEDIETAIHLAVEKAAGLRLEAARELVDLRNLFHKYLEGVRLTATPRVSLVKASRLQTRLDAAYHDACAAAVEDAIREGPWTTLGDFCEQVFLPGIFKRIHVQDPQYGAPYYLGASMFWLEPLAKGILSRRTSLFEDVQLKAGTILMQGFGQEGGLIGRLAWVGEHLDGSTTTHMLVRLRAADPELTGYLWAFLDSDAGYSLVRRIPYGGSIPHVDEGGMRRVLLPLQADNVMRDIGRRVLAAQAKREQALQTERHARQTIERLIEGRE